MNRIIRNLIMALSLITVLIGCESDKTKTEKQSKGTLITEKPLDLTIHMHFRNKYVYDPNGPVGKKAFDLTNIRLTETASDIETNSDEMFNLMMASGQIPDIVGGNDRKNDFIRYGMEGKLIPLDSLIDEYAPHIKKFFDDHPNVKESIKAPDGHIYYIPYVVDGTAARGYWIRKDWLDKLGLKEPQTVDEFHKTLIAFRDKDPNGNGLKDEIPLFFRHWEEIMRLTTMWGARTSGTDTYLSFYEEDGKIICGLIQPEFKEGMKNVIKWYKEKLIDPEVFTRGSKSREILFGKNIGGATRDWFASTGGFNKTLSETIPGFNLQAIAPPIGTDGKRVEESMRAAVKPDGWAITYENKHQEETIKYFDFYFTSEGRRLANFGIEGLHYTMKNGKPVFKDNILNADKAVNQILWEDGAQIPIGFQMDYEYEKQWTNAEALKGVKIYTENNYILEEFIEPTLTPEDIKIYDLYWSTITPYMTESIQNWILKGVDLDEVWPEYIENLRRMGLDEVLEVMQEAYEKRENNE